MQPVSTSNFGPLVAYLVPGAVALAGLSQLSPDIRTWFIGTEGTGPTIGGFLYLTIAAIAAGMTVSAIRWAIVDTLHHNTGLQMPRDFSKLGDKVSAYSLLIRIHYEHYQFYANAFVAIAIAYICHRSAIGWSASVGSTDVVFALIESLFLLTSRDTLRKYYSRGAQLLASPRKQRRSPRAVSRRVPSVSENR